MADAVTIEPQKVNIVIAQGADFVLPLQIMDDTATSTPKDLTGYTGVFKAADKEDMETAVISVADIAPTTALQGEISIKVPKADTTDIETLNHDEDEHDFKYNYMYDFYLVKDGVFEPVLFGELAIRPSVIGAT